MPTFAVILPAAGRSSRFNDPWRKKVFIDLQGRPVWQRTAEAFVHRTDVVQTILCISPEDHAWFREKFAACLAFMNVEVVDGGAERADSVQNALARVRPDVDYVAVHDAARPLIAPAWIDAVFAAATQSGAALLATPIFSTVKRVESGSVVETVDRTQLWTAQTPQVFARSLLEEAYARRAGFLATDEAQLVERIGVRSTIVEGSPLNIKITTPEDLRLAGAMLPLLPRDDRLKELDAPSGPRKQLW